MEKEYQKLLRKIEAGKNLTDAEIEKLPEGKLKDRVKKRQALNKLIGQETRKENKRQRDIDTRRKILAGAAALDEAERDATYKTAFYKLLDRFLTKPNDRALFEELPPLPPPPLRLRLLHHRMPNTDRLRPALPISQSSLPYFRGRAPPE
jgi:hypothetical protein